MAMEAPTVLASAPVVMPAPVKIERDTGKWLRKTRLCAYSIAGSCRFGSECTFAHSAAEVHEAPNLSKTQLCTAYAAGRCSKDNCSFAHGLEELRISPNSKSKICKWFQKGMCRDGAKCSFAHGSDQLRGFDEWGSRPRTNAEGQPHAISPPPGLSLAAPEVKAPIVFELEDCLLHGEPPAVSPPPGLTLAAPEEKAPIISLELADCLLDVKVPTKAKFVLDLQNSILDEKVPQSKELLQLEGMAAQITALQKQIDDMAFHTGASSMKKVLDELTERCADVQQSIAAPTDRKKMPITIQSLETWTALSSKAAPFQPGMPSTWSPQAKPCLPAAGETYWSSDDSTSVGSGGFFSD